MRSYLYTVYKKLQDAFLQVATSLITTHWSPYSRLFLVSDSPIWVIAWEMQELESIVKRLGLKVTHGQWYKHAQNQSVFYGSQFFLLNDAWLKQSHHVATAFFHGKPESGVREFDLCYQKLCQNHLRIHRIQVSHREMRGVVLSSGISPEKVFLIPIGINLHYFTPQTPESKRTARLKYIIPESAVVVGSFQKDGVGWGEGLQPKLIKGPDTFLKTIEILNSRIPNLFVLLSGPARGYVKAGLERLGVPHKHYYLKNYPEVGQLYQALDLYMVTSRQEGGPKAVLESMASKIPLVTTRVGQAMDIVHHGQNGWIVEIEDTEGLACWTEYALTHPGDTKTVLQQGLLTAQSNSYESQINLWRDFMRGFVEIPEMNVR